jgi:hypothetical protein
MIFQIGKRFGGKNVRTLRYTSDEYLLEADILIIDLNSVVEEINESFLRDKTSIYDSRWSQLNNYIADRNEQISTYLNNGGNLFVFLIPGYINLRVVNIGGALLQNGSLDVFNLVGLNQSEFILKPQSGELVDLKETHKFFFEKFYVSYKFWLVQHPGTTIATVAKTETPVSIQIPIQKGNIIVLPSITNKTNAEIAVIFSEYDQFLKASKEDEVNRINLPDWVKQYTLGSESLELNKLSILKEKRTAIEKKIADQNDVLTYYDNLKQLIFASGNELEQIVESLFKEIGYQIEAKGKGKDDIIMSHLDEVAVVEIKGVKGSGAEKHAAQLMKWVNNYHIEKDNNPKGILLVNAFNSKPINERTEDAFPNQMLPYCKQQRFCLLTSIQLLEIYLDFKDGKITFESIHNLLFATEGVLQYKSVNKVKTDTENSNA